MTLLHTEVAVVGGGMVGGALALGLAQQGFEVTVIEQVFSSSTSASFTFSVSWYPWVESSRSAILDESYSFI